MMPTNTRKRDLLVAVFLVLLAGYSIIQGVQLRAEQNRQQECVTGFLSADGATSKIRSDLIGDESQANRKVIRQALSARSASDIEEARRSYDAAIARIDKVRAENPIEAFSDKRCQDYIKESK